MDALIEHFSQHHDHLLYAAACVSLLLELGVMGMSGPLLFVALGCLASGLLVTLQIINGWPLELLMVAVSALLSAVGLWKPLKNFQNAGGGPDTSSDMIGKKLLVTLAISADKGRVAYSGIEWQARSDESISEPIAAGSHVQVVAVNGSLLIVKSQ